MAISMHVFEKAIIMSNSSAQSWKINLSFVQVHIIVLTVKHIFNIFKCIKIKLTMSQDLNIRQGLMVYKVGRLMSFYTRFLKRNNTFTG